MKSIKKHLAYYLSLISILGFGFILMVLFSQERQIQLLILLMIAFFYVFWGISHHGIHHSISAKIVIEYIGIATVGIAVVLFVLQGL